MAGMSPGIARAFRAAGTDCSGAQTTAIALALAASVAGCSTSQPLTPPPATRARAQVGSSPVAAPKVVGPVPSGCADDATVEDGELRRAIRLQLGKTAERPLSADERQQLTHLDVRLDSGGVSTLAGIGCFEALRELRIHAGGIQDLSPLTTLANLEILELDNHELQDISPLRRLERLHTLILSRNDIEDLAPLAGLHRLRALALLGGKITDLAPIAGLTQLEDLDLSQNQIEELGPLAALSGLRVLDVSHNRIGNLSPIAGLRKLRWLGATDNQIKDTTPLAGLTELVGLWLSRNPLVSAAPLARLGPFQELELPSGAINGPALPQRPGLAKPQKLIARPLRALRQGTVHASLQATCRTIHEQARQVLSQLQAELDADRPGMSAQLLRHAPHFGECFPTRGGAWAVELLAATEAGLVWQLTHLSIDGARSSLRPPDVLAADNWGTPPSDLTDATSGDSSALQDGLFQWLGSSSMDASHLEVVAVIDYDGDGEQELVVKTGRYWSHEAEPSLHGWIWTFKEGSIRPYPQVPREPIEDVGDWQKDGRPDLVLTEPFVAYEMACGKDRVHLALREAYLAWSRSDGSFSTSGAPAERFLRARCPARPEQLVQLEKDRLRIGESADAHEVWWIDSVATGQALFCARLWGVSVAEARAPLVERCSRFVSDYGCRGSLGLRECPRWLFDWAALTPPLTLCTDAL